MIPALVTVVGTGSWEPELVAAARTCGLARILGRCLEPAAVEDRLDRADLVVVGIETPWLDRNLVRRWRAHGVAVVAMASPDDHNRELAAAWGCDAVESTNRAGVDTLCRILTVAPPRPAPKTGRLLSVTGPRGAPGRSEIALSLATAASTTTSTALVELDPSPTLGLRLGLRPRPGLGQADPSLRSPAPPPEPSGPALVLGGAGAGPLTTSLQSRVVEAARRRHQIVVADVGPDQADPPGEPLVVCTPEAHSVVRAATLLSRWAGSTPMLVLNRAPEDPEELELAVHMLRAATGLEPAAILPRVRDLDWGGPAHPELVTGARSLLEEDDRGTPNDPRPEPQLAPGSAVG